jgi:hypothetical protein
MHTKELNFFSCVLEVKMLDIARLELKFSKKENKSIVNLLSDALSRKACLSPFKLVSDSGYKSFVT